MGWGVRRFLRSGSRRVGRAADGGFTDEDGTGFDSERFCFDVADDFCGGFEFDVGNGGDVAMDFAIDHDRACLDFGFQVGVFADGQVAIGRDFPFDFAIYEQVIGEFDGAFDFDIRGKDVTVGSGHGTCGRCGESWFWVRSDR